MTLQRIDCGDPAHWEGKGRAACTCTRLSRHRNHAIAANRRMAEVPEDKVDPVMQVLGDVFAFQRGSINANEQLRRLTVTAQC